MTLTRPGRRRLCVVRTAAADVVDDVDAGPVPTPPPGVPAEESAAERLPACARALDESAATTERIAGHVAELRRALLSGDATTAGALAVTVAELLPGVARVLAEVHGDLEEIAHALGGGPTGGGAA